MIDTLAIGFLLFVGEGLLDVKPITCFGRFFFFPDTGHVEDDWEILFVLGCLVLVVKDALHAVDQFLEVLIIYTALGIGQQRRSH